MYRKIMVPLDGSQLAECVLPHVEAIARGCGVGEVILVSAVENFNMPTGELGYTFSDEEIKQIDINNEAHARNYLEQVAGRVQMGNAGVQTLVITGKAAESLAGYATNNDIDLIVIATHGRTGWRRLIFGSVAEKVMRLAPHPVLTVRQSAYEED